MKGPLKKYKAWRSRRRLLALQRWEQIRTKGQARFVIQTALTWGLAVAGMLDVADHIFGYGPDFATFAGRAIYYPVAGIFVGFTSWSGMEAKYKNALIEARVKAAPSGQLPPETQASQISK